MALTPKQAQFAREFVVDLNASQAAIRAGYSAKTARSIAHELLRKPEVEAAIADAVRERAERTNIDADRVLLELARVGFADIGQAVDWTETEVKLRPAEKLSDDMRAAISEVRQGKDGLSLKLHNKIAALDALGRHVGLFAPTKHEHSGPNGKPIEMKDMTAGERARRIAALVAQIQAGDQS